MGDPHDSQTVAGSELRWEASPMQYHVTAGTASNAHENDIIININSE